MAVQPAVVRTSPSHLLQSCAVPPAACPLQHLPLVPRHGAGELRERGGGQAVERQLCQHQGEPGSSAGQRRAGGGAPWCVWHGLHAGHRRCMLHGSMPCLASLVETSAATIRYLTCAPRCSALQVDREERPDVDKVRARLTSPHPLKGPAWAGRSKQGRRRAGHVACLMILCCGCMPHHPSLLTPLCSTHPSLLNPAGLHELCAGERGCRKGTVTEAWATAGSRSSDGSGSRLVVAAALAAPDAVAAAAAAPGRPAWIGVRGPTPATVRLACPYCRRHKAAGGGP